MKRGLLIGVGVVIVVVVAAVYFLASSLDSLVKAAVETYGSEVAGTTVRLDKAEISPTEGSGALKGLTIGNPKGFGTDSAFRLGQIKVSLDVGSITSDPVVIKEIVITRPEVTYEIGPAGSNIDAIQKNVNAFVARHGGKGGGKPAAKGDQGPKLVINDLYIRGGQVNVSATALQGRKLGTALPEIHLKDIGKKQNGAGPGEVAETIIAALTKNTGMAVKSLNLDKVLGQVQGAVSAGAETAKKAIGKEGAKVLKGVTEGTGGALKGVTKGTGGAVEGVTGEAGKALKKLFGK